MNHYERARADIGTYEWKDGHNPKVLDYFRDSGNAWVKDDETAWCAAFVGAILERSGIKSTRKLNARSYLDWGEPVGLNDARPGDVAVFWRDTPTSWMGHVSFFVRDNGVTLDVLGGNQADQVNVSKYPKSQLLGIRRPRNVTAPPAPPAVEVPNQGGWLAALLQAIAALFRGKAK